MSERDLPSKIEMESNPTANHLPNMVKSSKSVPALHEHTKQHEVFNPGYSRYILFIIHMILCKTEDNKYIFQDFVKQ